MERKLTAILCADVFGYSRLMGEDEEATLRTLSSHRRTIDGLIEQHHGRFVNSAGDSILAEFASVVNAVQCAVEIQSALKIENGNLPTERRMEFRIGVNLGDVMVEGEQIYGDGVNVAARLESLAEPSGICVSHMVHENVRSRLPLSFEDLGKQVVKNIAEPVHLWRVLLDGTTPRRQTRQIPREYWSGGVLSLTGLAIIVGTIVLVQNLTLKPPHTHASIPPAQSPALPLPAKPSIAVLPFINMSEDHEQEYFSDGITDDLITDLSRLKGLFVIARDSSFTYKGKAAKVQDVGRELGVKHVLDGSVRKAAGQVRITVQLADATTGAELWAERYDRPLRDVFALQDEIVRRIVTTLNLQLTLSQRGILIPRTTENLDAYDDLLRATEYFWNQTKDDNAKAQQWLEKAIALDPKFSAAYSFLGWAHYLDAWNQWSQNPQADFERSSQLARTALALDDSNSDAFALQSNVDWNQRRFDQAVVDGERAVALNPNYAGGYQALSDALETVGKPEEALRAAEQAIRLDPSRPDFYSEELGNAYEHMGRYQEAISLDKRYLAAHPNSLVHHLGMVLCYIEVGRDQDARAEAAEVMRISPNFALPPPEKGWHKDLAWNERWDRDFRKAGLR